MGKQMTNENKPPVSDADRLAELLQAGWSSPTTTKNMLNEMKNKDARIAELEAEKRLRQEDIMTLGQEVGRLEGRIAELEAENGVLKDGLNYSDEILKKETIKRCAQVADKFAHEEDEAYAIIAREIAAAIRAEKDKP